MKGAIDPSTVRTDTSTSTSTYTFKGGCVAKIETTFLDCIDMYGRVFNRIVLCTEVTSDLPKGDHSALLAWLSMIKSCNNAPIPKRLKKYME